MDKIVLCVSWIAVSSEEQAGSTLISLPNQSQGNREFIDSISTRYPGKTGVLLEELQVAHSRRITLFDQATKVYPAYARLRKMIEAKAFHLLVAHKWDRLGRAESLVISVRDFCLDHGIAVVVREAIPSTIDASLLRNDEAYRISGIFGAWSGGREDREIGRRSREGRTHAARSGRIYLGKWPYGYDWSYDTNGNRRVVINPLEGDVVRRVFDMYVNDEISRVQIAEFLTVEGIPSPRGSNWSETSIFELINRASFYAGTMTINRRGLQPEESFLGVYPPLITEETAQRVEQLIESRKRGKRPNYAVPAACTCGYCGHAMVGSSVRKSKGNHLYARCKACKLNVSELSIVEALRTTIQYVIDVGPDDFIVKDDIDEEKQRVLAEIKDKQSSIERVGKAIDRLFNRLEAGLTTANQIRARMKAKQKSIEHLTADLEQLTEKMSDLEDRNIPESRIQEIQQSGLRMLELRYEKPLMVRQWLRDHFKIVLTDEIDITLI
ncbi:hypothetical protein GC175_28365 [bacterium]|nr:hypothetical protein [bacterium]